MSDLATGPKIAFGDTRIPPRFWKKVRVADNGCWEWMATKIAKGYGQVWGMPLRRNNMLAHRYAFILSGGVVSPQQVLDHLCNNPPCVNPAHLRPCTMWQNTQRGVGVTATNARKTHCPKNHPYAGPNLIRYSGFRYCRACKRERDRINGAKLRAALRKENP